MCFQYHLPVVSDKIAILVKNIYLFQDIAQTGSVGFKMTQDCELSAQRAESWKGVIY